MNSCNFGMCSPINLECGSQVQHSILESAFLDIDEWAMDSVNDWKAKISLQPIFVLGLEIRTPFLASHKNLILSQFFW